MRTATAAYLVAWRRGSVADPPAAGAGASDPAGQSLRVDWLRGRPAVAEVLYPRSGRPPVSWEPERGELSVMLPDAPAACLVRVSPR
jgi:hypothetical protein